MQSQKEICIKYGAIPYPPKSEDKLGIATDTIGTLPINGLRHNPENGNCGWYIWCGGELSEDPEFFKPVHISHVPKYLPEIERFLALPPGYRFLIAGAHEDVWYDPSIIDIRDRNKN